MYLKGQRTPAHGLWIDFCRLGFSWYVHAVCTDCQPGDCVYVCLYCAVHVSVKWAVSSMRARREYSSSSGAKEPKNSLKAERLRSG